METMEAVKSGLIGMLLCTAGHMRQPEYMQSQDGQVIVNRGMVHRDGEWQPYWDGWVEWMLGLGWKRFGLYVWDKLNVRPGDAASPSVDESLSS